MKKLALLGFVGAMAVGALVLSQDIEKNVLIVVNADIKDDVIDAYAWQFNYQETIRNAEGETVPNPESKAQFANRMFVEMAQSNIRSMYKSYMRYLGAEAAALEADSASFGITVQ